MGRLVEQALHQVLQPTFSEERFGFRPGRSAYQAVRRAQMYLRDGKRCVVGLDLEKFLDGANHEVLMARVARQVRDARVLNLIRRCLTAGMMQDRLVTPRVPRKWNRSRRCCPASC